MRGVSWEVHSRLEGGTFLRLRYLSVLGGVCALAIGVAACGDDGGGGGGKLSSTLNIYSSFPLQGASGPQSKAMNDGAKLALEQAGGKVGSFTIKFEALDDSTAAAGGADDAKTGQNARKAVQDKSAIGYIGEYNSGATKVSLPILNKANIPQISPANTYVGLTTDKPGSEPGEPDKYYPSGNRTYARVVPADDIQGAAIATAAKDAGCKSLMIWNSKTTYSAGLARNLDMAAKKDGIQVEGNQGIDPKAANYRSQAGGIKSDCFAFTGEIESNGVQAVKDVASAKPNIKLFGGDGVMLNDFANPKTGLPADIGARFKGTIATLDPKSFGPEGKKFFAEFSQKYNVPRPDPYAIYGYEAMQLMLDSIKRANLKTDMSIEDARKAVLEQLFNTKNRQSVLGTYSIDENGDTSLTDYGLYRIAGGKLEFEKVLKAKGA
jgi:branched-chain amino acid transport system substrate-binding protein